MKQEETDIGNQARAFIVAIPMFIIVFIGFVVSILQAQPPSKEITVKEKDKVITETNSGEGFYMKPGSPSISFTPSPGSIYFGD